jgi:hypothetical protein
MQEYPIKRGLAKDLDSRIAAELRNCFGVEPERAGTTFRIRYGALKRLEAAGGSGGKTLVVDTESDIAAGDEVIIDTNRRFRKFLDAVTGFSTKERVKRSKGGAGE